MLLSDLRKVTPQPGRRRFDLGPPSPESSSSPAWVVWRRQCWCRNRAGSSDHGKKLEPCLFQLPSLSSLPWLWRSSLGRALQPALCLSLHSPRKPFATRRTGDSAIVFVATWLDSTVCFDFLFSLLFTVSSAKWSQPPRLSRRLLWTDPRRRHLPQPLPGPHARHPCPGAFAPPWPRPTRLAGMPDPAPAAWEPPAQAPSVSVVTGQSALVVSCFLFWGVFKESHLELTLCSWKCFQLKQCQMYHHWISEAIVHDWKGCSLHFQTGWKYCVRMFA